WSTSKTPSYTKSVSWQHHPGVLNEINNEITQQSLSISANEIFRMAAIAFILLTVLVWFAKPPFTAKGVG
ncbi:hypothetical protein, partial [Escherichia coli]|uniref:hypothetical protein n=1 Tax=Escherichia coli TaxID=562 RepID=UPI001CDAA52E